MKLHNLEKTMLICIQYHLKRNNSIRVKQLEDKLEEIKKSSLFCNDSEKGLYLQDGR